MKREKTTRLYGFFVEFITHENIYLHYIDQICVLLETHYMVIITVLKQTLGNIFLKLNVVCSDG